MWRTGVPGPPKGRCPLIFLDFVGAGRAYEALASGVTAGT